MSAPSPRSTLARLLACTALASASLGQTSLYVTEYQFNNPKVRSMDLNGANVVELFAPPAGEWLPVGPAFDAGAGKLYWADAASPNNVLRANLDGSSLTSLVGLGANTAKGVALDGSGRMYYTAGNQIRRANLDGSGEQTLFTAAQTFPLSAPYVDGTNGHVYFWADEVIRRMDLDGANPKSVVTGVSSVRAIELDVEQSLIYWLDADTISDFVGRARLDDTAFTVLVDVSPSVVQSSGLIALLLEHGQGKLYYADDLTDTVRRSNFDGSGDQFFYAPPAGLSPSGITASTGTHVQPIADCNNNGVDDALDISSGSSSDCNANGFPDDCESGDPCTPPILLLDHGSDPVPSSRTVGGPSPAPGSQFEVFQPFDVPAGGWSVERIGFDGWTANFADGTGFTATLLPDDGSGTFPDETSPVASQAYNFRFNTDTIVWVDEHWGLSLSPNRYWLRLTGNDAPTYHGAINLAAAGSGGLNSISRSGLGNLFAAGPVALRISRSGCPSPTIYCTAKVTSSGCTPAIGFSGAPVVGGSFGTSCTQVPPGVPGIIFYGGSGSASIPFQGGFLCAQPPITRVLPVQNSGGAAACSGAFAHDFSPLLGSGDFAPGNSLWLEYWFRDPPASFGSGLSNALAITVCP